MPEAGCGDESQSAVDQPLASLLRTALAMERRVAESLPDLIAETVDPILRKELEQHLGETREHVGNVEEMFRSFGQEPASATDPVLEALGHEHRALLAETPDTDRVLAVAATAVAAEHAEIARYEVLRVVAESRGNSHAVTLIVRTLEQERQALKLVCESMHRLLAPPKVDPKLLPSTQGPSA